MPLVRETGGSTEVRDAVKRLAVPRPLRDEAHTTADAVRYWCLQFCAAAANESAQEHMAMKVQLMEWQLLFQHCARPGNGFRAATVKER